MGRSFRVKVIHMNTETTAKPMVAWRRAMVMKGLKPETIDLKIRCAERCIEAMGDADLSKTDPDDLRRLSDSFGDITATSKARLLHSFNEYLTVAHGISPYDELRDRHRVGSRSYLGIVFSVDPKLDQWAEWMVAHGADRQAAMYKRAAARNGYGYLMERYPDIDPGDITPEMLLSIEDGYPAVPQRANAIANSLAAFAEWCGAGPVAVLYHDLRTNRSWEGRVFSGKFGDRIRSYHDFMVRHYFRPSTCRSQVNSVVYAIQIIEEVLGDFELEELTPEDLFDVRFTQTRVSEPTLRTYLTVFGQFVLHCIGTNPYSDRLMRWNNGLVARRIFLTQEEFMTIAREADPTERIVVVLGATLGLRKVEIVNLKVSDIGTRFVHVEGKGSGPMGKVSDQVLDPDTAALIDEYLEYRRKVLDTHGDFSEGRLVVCDRGINAGHPFTLEGMGVFIRKFSDRLGFRFSCHCFRRYYATSLYDSGVDLNMIRTMMRHTKLETTLGKYIDVDTRKMAVAQSGIGSSIRSAMVRV